ncbi:MAG: radical SAM family heme chaperone HemW [Melioribacteraceae bacterium]|nr:radical SAM family heme chaperone HemW [Melioribacteraceae bacterium]
MKNTAIYIHIPFCDHKCIYCDFYSLISYDNTAAYLTALKKEITFYAGLFAKKRIIDTIFFGGGTPSFMSPNYISEIINSISQNFQLSPNAEITLETNPGTVSAVKLKEFIEVGINRISIGIQSFDEKELKFLTRIHDKQTAIKTVEEAHNVGFTNISVDLIFSLPNQSEKIWMDNLRTAVNLPITHISAYSLILEKGTILNKMVLDGKVKMNSENHDADLYSYTIEFLEKNNFAQYEVSNFSHKGFECRHNKYYWEYNDYLSFGTAAHSFVDGIRWWNYSSLKMYIDKINNSGNAKRGEEKIEYSQMIDEYIMLSLRSGGLKLVELKEKFSANWYIKRKDMIDRFISDKFLILDENLLKCTAKGYAVCDEIITKLL